MWNHRKPRNPTPSKAYKIDIQSKYMEFLMVMAERYIEIVKINSVHGEFNLNTYNDINDDKF